MIPGYDELYLAKAQNCLGCMLDIAVCGLGHSLTDFWDIFLQSPYANRFAHGEPNLLVGMSGWELAYHVLGTPAIQPSISGHSSPAYWTGWALAYYQWRSGHSFQEIQNFAAIDAICNGYHPFHEMDILQFVDWMDEKRGCHELLNMK